jgi:hypothetical protein
MSEAPIVRRGQRTDGDMRMPDCFAGRGLVDSLALLRTRRLNAPIATMQTPRIVAVANAEDLATIRLMAPLHRRDTDGPHPRASRRACARLVACDMAPTLLRGMRVGRRLLEWALMPERAVASAAGWCTR